ncbi:hypothetical protein BC828DRAFT_388805 [Blastocladiella britannica]|nr:hypothetical protein BC828DRAFT_388805 [Blastocladiella britannica]
MSSVLSSSTSSSATITPTSLAPKATDKLIPIPLRAEIPVTELIPEQPLLHAHVPISALEGLHLTAQSVIAAALSCSDDGTESALLGFNERLNRLVIYTTGPVDDILFLPDFIRNCALSEHPPCLLYEIQLAAVLALVLSPPNGALADGSILFQLAQVIVDDLHPDVSFDYTRGSIARREFTLTAGAARIAMFLASSAHAYGFPGKLLSAEFRHLLGRFHPAYDALFVLWEHELIPPPTAKKSHSLLRSYLTQYVLDLIYGSDETSPPDVKTLLDPRDVDLLASMARHLLTLAIRRAAAPDAVRASEVDRAMGVVSCFLPAMSGSAFPNQGPSGQWKILPDPFCEQLDQVQAGMGRLVRLAAIVCLVIQRPKSVPDNAVEQMVNMLLATNHPFTVDHITNKNILIHLLPIIQASLEQIDHAKK